MSFLNFVDDIVSCTFVYVAGIILIILWSDDFVWWSSFHSIFDFIYNICLLCSHQDVPTCGCGRMG